MTREEAYNAMQEGMPVSHKDFREGEYLWMDDNWIIKDENGDDFESSWDVQEVNERWKTGWYIYKNKTKVIKRKAIPFKRKEESYIEEHQFVSHIQGHECVGKDNCLQYHLGGETACVVCDVSFENTMISDNTKIYPLLEENVTPINFVTETEYVNTHINKKQPIWKRILLKLRRKY